MELILKRLNIKGNIADIKKKIIKRIIRPTDILFLTFSVIFISVFIYEQSILLVDIWKNHISFFHYLFQMKFKILFGIFSGIMFVSTFIIWIKEKVKSLFAIFIPIVKNNSSPLVTAYYSFCFK